MAIQMVKLFPGKFWEIIINVSLNEDNPNEQVFQLGPLLMQRGYPQHRLFKIQLLYCSRGNGFFAAKTLDFKSSIEVLKEFRSLYKMDQL